MVLVFLPLIFYSVIAAGGVYSAASASLTPSELAEQMEHGGTDVIVACPETRETVTLAARLCGIPLSRILVLESMGNKRSLSTVADGEDNLMRSMHKLDWERITDAETLEQRLICLLYSSGTTGPPKGVMISNMNMVSEAILPQYMIRAYLARRKDADPNFSFDYRTLAHLPAAHVAGCQGYFINPAIAGGPVYWMPKFNLPDFLKYCESLKISYLSTVPPIYLLIAKSPLVKDQFKYLVHAQSGAAPMGSELQTLTQKRLGCFVSQTWGLTESTGGFTTMPWDRNDLTGSISPILPNTRVRIVGEDERDADEGSRGEILIKGPIVTKGYFKDPEATANAFTAEGWFRTGDVGLRKNGMFYIVDRKKELIKYKGLQVAPAELEALLLGLEKVQDVAVIGIPDPDGSGNELPRAYVVMGTGPGSLSAEQIKAHVKSNLAQHK
ncbi:hypothetical protein LTR04_006054 [Oleoguttula sp. CCFEE 6159]|nr:hypothetical protein LTR04_006054 [Oleoguttula sp. CCFEE 6159]